MEYQIDRRTFIAGSLLIPTLKFPSEARKRLAVSTYPFRDFIASKRKPEGKLTLQRFAETLVEKFKVNGIEPWSG